jgi:NAD(P)-dependent dehydrogenase (short-subunit alcohol dehydrogenase family)
MCTPEDKPDTSLNNVEARMDIAGSIALVAGGACGAGLAVTSALHEAGASVVILDRPGSDGAAVAAALGPRAMFSAGEAASPADVDAALDAAGALAGGVPRIVVCGPASTGQASTGLAGTGLASTGQASTGLAGTGLAGTGLAGSGLAGSGLASTGAPAGAAVRTTGPGGPFPLEDFSRVIHAQLIGTFNVIRLAADRLSRVGAASGEPGGERGVIITTAAGAALDGRPGQAAYAAAAAGIAGLTQPVARDLAPLNIRVMTIAPGWPSGSPRAYAALVTHIVRNPGLNAETIRLDRLSQ